VKPLRLGGGVWAVPDFASYAMAFSLKLRKSHGKTSVRVNERCSAYRCWTRFV